MHITQIPTCIAGSRSRKLLCTVYLPSICICRFIDTRYKILYMPPSYILYNTQTVYIYAKAPHPQSLHVFFVVLALGAGVVRCACAIYMALGPPTPTPTLCISTIIYNYNRLCVHVSHMHTAVCSLQLSAFISYQSSPR